MSAKHIAITVLVTVGAGLIVVNLFKKIAALKNMTSAAVIRNIIVLSIFSAGGLILGGYVIESVLLVFFVASTLLLYWLMLVNRRIRSRLDPSNSNFFYKGTPDDDFTFWNREHHKSPKNASFTLNDLEP